MKKQIKSSLHVAIIMDGNGRWATSQSQPRLVGHRAGVDVLKDIVKACPEHKIGTLTLFAFAIANWKRDKSEVDGLWELFTHFFEEELDQLISEEVQVKVIGNRDGLPKNIRNLVNEAEEKSKHNTSFLLQVALNYDGLDEVARLVKRCLETKTDGELITADYILNNLDTNGTRPDIVIRTGMQKPEAELAVWRSSAFLPLQSVQSVCVSTTTLWPDFTAEELQKIIEYADPDTRLFGGQRGR